MSLPQDFTDDVVTVRLSPRASASASRYNPCDVWLHMLNETKRVVKGGGTDGRDNNLRFMNMNRKLCQGWDSAQIAISAFSLAAWGFAEVDTRGWRSTREND